MREANDYGGRRPCLLRHQSVLNALEGRPEGRPRGVGGEEGEANSGFICPAYSSEVMRGKFTSIVCGGFIRVLGEDGHFGACRLRQLRGV